MTSHCGYIYAGFFSLEARVFCQCIVTKKAPPLQRKLQTRLKTVLCRYSSSRPRWPTHGFIPNETKKIAWHGMYSISNWKAVSFSKTVVIHRYTIHMYNKPLCMYSIETSIHLDYICLYTDRSTTFSSFQVTIMMQKSIWGKAFYWQWLEKEVNKVKMLCLPAYPLFRPQRVTELQFISYSTLWLQHFEDCYRDVIILLVLEWKPHRKISHLLALLFTLFLFSVFLLF